MVPEGRRVFSRLTVEENLAMGGFFTDKDDYQVQMDKVLELFPRLKERYEQRAGTMSGGEQQMLAIGRALMSKPKLLLLDEPSLGLAPIIIQQIFEIIEQLRREGVTVFLVEQNANQALKLADRAYVLGERPDRHARHRRRPADQPEGARRLPRRLSTVPPETSAHTKTALTAVFYAEAYRLQAVALDSVQVRLGVDLRRFRQAQPAHAVRPLPGASCNAWCRSRGACCAGVATVK
ncbi:branched-chain amino acid transport protein BraG [Pseudomonas aeruginosa]|nr:branched-chain amino acid transport protein BraG [Pseudomonas aeruginosa]